MFTGIDVSEHNGNIDWSEAKHDIDFAIIRVGYGKNNIDKKAIYNIEHCIYNNIPFGLYWFSYALSPEMCAKEAEYICNIADNYKPLFPIAFDWEYDSEKYAEKNGVKMTPELRVTFANTFLSNVQKRGYIPMLYTNLDFIKKGFDKIVPYYQIWLAQWNSAKPSVNCAVWQKTNKGTIKGINGNVDVDLYLDEYAKNVININKAADANDILERMYKMLKEYFEGKT